MTSWGNLDRGLDAALRVLRPGGRIVVLTFHSLEDRRVKHFIKDKSGRGQSVSRHLPMPSPDDLSRRVFLNPLTGRGVRASDAEVSVNRRARSAILRAAIRTDAPLDRIGLMRLPLYLNLFMAALTIGVAIFTITIKSHIAVDQRAIARLNAQIKEQQNAG